MISFGLNGFAWTRFETEVSNGNSERLATIFSSLFSLLTVSSLSSSFNFFHARELSKGLSFFIIETFPVVYIL